MAVGAIGDWLEQELSHTQSINDSSTSFSREAKRFDHH
jgi:hypothetical protein